MRHQLHLIVLQTVVVVHIDGFLLPSSFCHHRQVISNKPPSPDHNQRLSLHTSRLSFTRIFAHQTKEPVNEEENEGENNEQEGDLPILSMFESTVRSVSGNSEYKFGDLSKNALGGLTGKDLKNEKYKFGDISKNIVTQAGKAVSGKDDYKFGDITKGLLSDIDSTLQDWKGRTLNNLPMTVYEEYMEQFTPQQRRVLLVSLIRFAAIALLTWGFWSNLCTSFSISISWLRTAWTTSPPATAKASISKGIMGASLGRRIVQGSGVFVRTYTMLRILLDPFFLVLQGAGTVFTVLRYERFVGHLEHKRIPSWIGDQYPLLARVAALVLAFGVNQVVALVASTLGVGVASVVGYYKWR